MLRLRLFLCLWCAVVAANSCVVPDPKEDQEIHVFHIGASNDGPGNEPDIIELHIPDSRKKREVSEDEISNSCALGSDCPPGWECILETATCRAYDE